MKPLRSPHTHAILWALVVTIGMLLPGDALPPFRGWLPVNLQGWVDKIEHLVAFFVMMILAFRSLRASGLVERPLLVAIVATCGLALGLEILQIPHPSRHWAPADLVADAIGILLALPFLSRLLPQAAGEG